MDAELNETKTTVFLNHNELKTSIDRVNGGSNLQGTVSQLSIKVDDIERRLASVAVLERSVN